MLGSTGEAESGDAGEQTRQGIASWKLIQTMSRGVGLVVDASIVLDRFPHAFLKLIKPCRRAAATVGTVPDLLERFVFGVAQRSTIGWPSCV